MKLICIKTRIYQGDYSDFIMLGKTYISDKIQDDSKHYRIFLKIDDDNSIHYLPKQLFIPIDEWRDQQINKLI